MPQWSWNRRCTDSFVTPDYNEVTVAVGTEVQKALQGQKTAAQAIADAQDQVAAIVKRRM
jgi:multiple sugar transport system substrate-binding protein